MKKRKMTNYRVIAIWIIILITVQVIPGYSISANSADISTKEAIPDAVKSSDIPELPAIVKYLSPPDQWDLPVTFDTITTYSIVATILTDPLVDYSYDTKDLTPALATQWVVSDDAKHWVFTLRKNVTFHDGSKFNATSVKFTFDRFIDPSHPAYVENPVVEYTEMPLESVEILDEYKVSFNFFEPYAPFIYREIPYTGIYSPNSFGGGTNLITPIGTGPYYLDSVSPGFYRYIRNDDYFLGIPPFEEFHHIIYNSTDAFQAALDNHEGHITTINEGPTNENDPYWEYTRSTEYTGIEYGIFNYDHPILKDKNVRLAINYAISKQAYIEQQAEGPSMGEEPLHSVIYSGLPYHDDSIKGYPYNIALANNILDRAGYLRKSDGYRFELDLVGFWDAFDSRENIQEQLELIGIRCNNIGAGIPYLRNGFFDIFILGWAGIYDPSFTWRLLHTSGDINWGGYSNSLIDYYTIMGQETPIRQEREYYYSRVQEVAQSEAPLLLLSETRHTYWRAHNVSSFINGGLAFNFSKNNDLIYNTDDVEVSSESLYLPLTDTVIAQKGQQQLLINMSMTNEISSLLPNQIESGKLFNLKVNDSEQNYVFRGYYDLDEIYNSNLPGEPFFSQWDNETQTWIELKAESSNNKLRYLEITLKGDSTIRLSLRKLIELTYEYLPIILLVVGPTIIISTYIIRKNQQVSKKLKKEYDLFDNN